MTVGNGRYCYLHSRFLFFMSSYPVACWCDWPSSNLHLICQLGKYQSVLLLDIQLQMLMVNNWTSSLDLRETGFGAMISLVTSVGATLCLSIPSIPCPGCIYSLWLLWSSLLAFQSLFVLFSRRSESLIWSSLDISTRCWIFSDSSGLCE